MIRRTHQGATLHMFEAETVSALFVAVKNRRADVFFYCLQFLTKNKSFRPRKLDWKRITLSA
jgi:hypothetical protein